MKRYIKKIAFIIVLLFALIGIGGTIAFASGEITWGGTEDYNDTLDIFEQLKNGIINQQKAKQEVDRLLAKEEEKVEKLENENEKLLTDIKNSIPKSDLAREITKIVNHVNDNENGPKHKYDYIKQELNNHKEFLGIKVELDAHGQSDEDKQLEQAIKDMEYIREEAEVLNSILLNEESNTGE